MKINLLQVNTFSQHCKLHIVIINFRFSCGLIRFILICCRISENGHYKTHWNFDNILLDNKAHRNPVKAKVKSVSWDVLNKLKEIPSFY